MTAAIRFPETRRPLASVVIPTYQSANYAVKALASLRQHTHDPYEVIVVDNASTDGGLERLSSGVAGVRVVLNARNYGFGAACNQGAALARAPFVVFLNSDAFVHEGWLLPLVDALAGEVGVAGPLMLNPDGSVQEAGACVSRSGRTVAFGTGRPATSRDIRFRRVVDYVSGACMAVRRSTFHEIGGFDASYGRGYFEDVDLCFELREHGYLTVYEPRATVTHIRGASTGGTFDQGLREANRLLFFRRWHAALAGRPQETTCEGNEALVLRDAAARERILVINADGAPAGCDRRLLGELIATWPASRVTLVEPHDDLDGRADELLALGIEIASFGTEPGEWFFERRFHYDVVIALQTVLPAEIEELLQLTQPRAFRFDSTVLEHASLVDVMAEGGVAPPGRSIAGPCSAV